MTERRETRSGFVALIGAPNAGKSTLVNQLVGAKVSIVSHKVQTTRTMIRGVAIRGDTQIVFMDTPGIFKPKRRLDRAMVSAAWGGARDADIIVLMIDARKGIRDEEEAILNSMCMATDMHGVNGNTVPALPLEEVKKFVDATRPIFASAKKKKSDPDPAFPTRGGPEGG